jgi:hypothetical protein
MWESDGNNKSMHSNYSSIAVLDVYLTRVFYAIISFPLVPPSFKPDKVYKQIMRNDSGQKSTFN